MFETLKFYPYIVVVGNPPSFFYSILQSLTTYSIESDFNDLETSSIILLQDSSLIPFNYLNLDDFFFLVFDDSFPFSKIKYGYQILSNLTILDDIKAFIFYYKHLHNTRVLNFYLGDNLFMDIINENKQRFIPTSLNRKEIALLKPKTKLPLFKNPLTLAQFIKSESLTTFDFSTAITSTYSYCLVNYNNKVFPFRYEGNTTFKLEYYRFKTKDFF